MATADSSNRSTTGHHNSKKKKTSYFNRSMSTSISNQLNRIFFSISHSIFLFLIIWLIFVASRKSRRRELAMFVYFFFSFTMCMSKLGAHFNPFVHRGIRFHQFSALWLFYEIHFVCAFFSLRSQIYMYYVFFFSFLPFNCEFSVANQWFEWVASVDENFHILIKLYASMCLFNILPI